MPGGFFLAKILQANSTTLWKQVVLWAALQTKSMVEVGLHAGEVGSLVQRCALVGTWQREQGAVTWEHGCYVRKPQWKCWWSWWGCTDVFLQEGSMSCVLCTVKNRSVKTWVGSGRQVAWHYWKPWLLEEVGVIGFLWWGSRSESTVQPTGIVPDEVGILEGFCPQNMSSSALFCLCSLLYYASHVHVLKTMMLSGTPHDLTEHQPTLWGKKAGCRSWPAGKASTPKL